MREKTKITYSQVNGYLIPNIILPPEQANITLGKWGKMHKDYLEHNKRGLFMLMVTKCTLWPYLADIDRQANEMCDLLIEQMKEAEGITEQLKEQDQFEWVLRMGNIQQRAREIVCNELMAAPKILCKSNLRNKQIIAGLQCSQTAGLVSYYISFLFAECYACEA